MKDPVFTGRDVAERRVAAAARALGRPRRRCATWCWIPAAAGGLGAQRHAGPDRRPARPGGAAPPARADLRAAAPRPRRRPLRRRCALARAPSASADRRPGAGRRPGAPGRDRGGTTRRCASASCGPDCEFFLEDERRGPRGARAPAAQAGHAPASRRRLIAGVRGLPRRPRRGPARTRALRLAEAVRAGRPRRRTEPLNAYERRIVHMTLAEVAGRAHLQRGRGATAG